MYVYIIGPSTVIGAGWTVSPGCCIVSAARAWSPEGRLSRGHDGVKQEEQWGDGAAVQAGPCREHGAKPVLVLVPSALGRGCAGLWSQDWTHAGPGVRAVERRSRRPRQEQTWCRLTAGEGPADNLSRTVVSASVPPPPFEASVPFSVRVSVSKWRRWGWIPQLEGAEMGFRAGLVDSCPIP